MPKAQSVFLLGFISTWNMHGLIIYRLQRSYMTVRDGPLLIFLIIKNSFKKATLTRKSWPFGTTLVQQFCPSDTKGI